MKFNNYNTHIIWTFNLLIIGVNYKTSHKNLCFSVFSQISKCKIVSWWLGHVLDPLFSVYHWLIVILHIPHNIYLSAYSFFFTLFIFYHLLSWSSSPPLFGGLEPHSLIRIPWSCLNLGLRIKVGAYHISKWMWRVKITIKCKHTNLLQTCSLFHNAIRQISLVI